MFTGIIKKTGIVKKIALNKKEMQIGVKSSLKFTNNDLGSSINCSGVCLTLQKIYNGLYYFYLSRETLKVSNFNNIKLNHIINLEKSLKFGDEISGHFVQGHVDTISKLKKIYVRGKSWYLYFSINKSLKKFLTSKSSIAINGVSLTIAKIFANSFLIVVIPHTLKMTNLKNIKNNDIVNIEIDIIAKYIKNLKI
ncbi:MAG TPA: riboflavin synthase [Pelagibacteraceae bacterium]|jgi:riboflavin synthase|nr:riboflavin synthase [Pelagibacteraceae bacterium]|tara:strand:- start:464 stop:1048 length:585 start_codon:yes stop_codon:yes gene_type:complete